MGALHSLENLFIETEEEEGRKNKHTAPSVRLLSVGKLCVQRGFAPKADGALELIWRKRMALKNIQQNKTYLFIYILFEIGDIGIKMDEKMLSTYEIFLTYVTYQCRVSHL